MMFTNVAFYDWYMNVALSSNGGVASQSTTFAVASRANDGSTNSLFDSGSISNTDNGTNQWWEVTLASTYPISQVKFYTRTDSCWRDKIQNFIMTIYRNGIEVYNSGASNPDESSTVKSIYTYQMSSGMIGDVVQIGMNMGNVELAEVVVNVREEKIA